MTDTKKAAKNQGGEKVKKLRLNKESIKDLNARKAGQVKAAGIYATRCDGC